MTDTPQTGKKGGRRMQEGKTAAGGAAKSTGAGTARTRKAGGARTGNRGATGGNAGTK